MSFFGKDGKSTPEWNLFLDNFPAVGVFKLLHDSDEAYIDKNVSSILRLDTDKLAKEQLFALIDRLNENRAEGYKDIYVYRICGETLYINLKIVYEQDCVMGFVRDVTSIMQSQSEKKSADSCDELTGIYTRNFFIRRVRDALAGISGMAQCCMAAVHINGIESTDSELNYDKTSLCISAAAGALKRFASDDVIIGVRSYKEFFIFFRQMTKQEVSELLRKISDSVKACRITDEFGNEIQTRNGPFTITCGYCWYPSQAATIDMMINYADFALFKAISSGSTDREFSPDQFVSDQNSYSDSRQLTELIDNNDFKYCFQPIVSAESGEIYAYEALMRPNNLTPLEVLRMAREHGKLYDIELLTFKNVLSGIAENIDKFKGKKIFINSIPDNMLKEHDFYSLLDKYESLIPNVVIELTEQSDLTDGRVQRQRELYCEKGCKIAIDDYGSGYSNSAAVLNLSPDIIKIDRALITGINKNTRKQHFLSGIIDFAKLNGIKVLAEGVETVEELRIVIRRGVDYIQGFYTARPSLQAISAIPEDIANEIKAANVNKPNIMLSKSYEIKENVYEPLDISLITAEKYTNISVSCDYVHLKGNTEEVYNLNILVQDNTTCMIVIEDVNLNGGVRSCVIIGENAKVRLEIKGQNSFLYDGIILPDSSDLTLVGEGNLYIDSYRNNGCCIGAPYNDPFGRIIIDITGTLELSANGDHAVCIGGGRTSRQGAVTIVGGIVNAAVTGVDSIAIGSYDGGCELFIANGSNVFISASGNNAVGIGSLYGMSDITASRCRLNIKSLGENACCIGNIAMPASGENNAVKLSEVNADLCLKAECGAAVGFRTADTDIAIQKSKMKVYFEGTAVCGIGSAEGTGTIEIDECDISVDSLAAEKSISIGMPEKGAKVHNTVINQVLTDSDDYKLKK